MARSSFVLFAAGLAVLAAAIQTPQQHVVDIKKLSVNEAPHLWPCKNGNLFRNGSSTLYSAPRDLTKPIWEWTVPGHTLKFGHIEASPLIDRDSNVYIETTTGGIFSLARDGTERWRRSEPGRMMTGALDGNSLYTVASTGRAMSIDLATGKKNWETQFCKGAGPDAATTTVADGTVVLAGTDGGDLTGAGGNDQIFALNTADGSEKWRFKVGVPFYNFMPAIHDGKITFIDITGRMYCLNLSDGSLRWKSQGDFQGSTTAGVALGPNGMAYTNFNTDGSNGGVLMAYDVETGEKVWSRSLGQEASAAPAVAKLGPDGPVGVIVGVGHNVGFWHPDLQDAKAKLRAFDAATGADLWTFETPSKMLHGSAGVFATFAQDTVPDTWSTAAVDKNGVVYAGWEGGKQYAVDGRTGKLISEHYNGWAMQGEPAIGDGFVVYPSVGKVVAFADA
jgi:outer membrane protein assembly factor BamB